MTQSLSPEEFDAKAAWHDLIDRISREPNLKTQIKLTQCLLEDLVELKETGKITCKWAKINITRSLSGDVLDLSQVGILEELAALIKKENESVFDYQLDLPAKMEEEEKP